jgi:AcrR family transcriptional regulator
MPVSQPPSRRPRISREYLEEHRRGRYVDAVAELLHEFGREGATVTNVVRLGGTARNSFYEVFGGIEDLLAYGTDAVARELFAALSDLDGADEWPVEVAEAIAGFYAAVADRPLRAELFLIHSPASRTEAGRVASRAGQESFVDLLRRGRDGAGRALPSSAEEYFSLATVSLAARRVRGADVEGLRDEARGMAASVIGFYLGPEAADRILGAATVQLVAG